MLNKIMIISAILFVFMGMASGLGITHASFGDVEQGKIYNIPVTVLTTNLDFDNHFVIEIEGELKDWVTVTPMEFDLPAGESMALNVSLRVPENAKLGKYNGSITAVGQKSVPSPGETPGGAAVGYTIAVRSLLSASVIKPGAVESVAITRMDAPGKVKPDSTVRFDVSIKNTGNIPATASPVLIISKGTDTTEIPGVPLELSVGEEKTAKLYWDAQEEGTYTAVVSIACGGKTVNSDPISIAVSPSIPGVQAFAVITIILASAALIRRKKA